MSEEESTGVAERTAPRQTQPTRLGTGHDVSEAQDVNPLTATADGRPTPDTPSMMGARIPQDDLSGTLISERYRVEECLGSGGMGTVWRAEHVLMKKVVAIKVLHPEVIGHGEAVERFRREAQTAAQIEHPNVCLATDFGEMERGGFFLVMEYLEGQTLAELLEQEGRLPPDRALRIIDQILAALAQAHKLGVVHRDLKPENVMLIERDATTDFVKIMDFGIARVQMDGDEEDARLTQAGRIYGTPMYMSPEQASGATDIDPRADLYSLGVMLFEMLSGTLPFMDKSIARILAMHITTPAPDLHEVVPDAHLPRRLTRLVASLLAKEPDGRPASADDVRAEIARIDLRTDTPPAIFAGALQASTRSDGIEDEQPPGAFSPLRGQLEQLREFMRDQLRTAPLRTTVLITATITTLVIGLVGWVWLATRTSAATDPGEMSLEARAETTQSLAQKRQDLLEKVGARDAVSALALGNATQALSLLEPVIANHDPNPHLFFMRARAHAIDDNWPRALLDYQMALQLEPDYRAVDRLVEDVYERFAAGDDAELLLATNILVEHLPPAETNRRLAEIARTANALATRRRAYNVLEEHGRLEQLEPWDRASIGLRFANGCSEHRQYIEELVAAKDPRGLEVLRYFDKRPRTGCGTFRRSDCLGCIRSDLKDAIKTLSALEPAAADAPAEAAPDAQNP